MTGERAGRWARHRSEETILRAPHAEGPYRFALAYPNTYHVGMSSLGFQRTRELVQSRPDWTCERFFTDGRGVPLSVESERPLSDFACAAFSVSFEEDYLGLLRLLARAGIAVRRADRTAWDPLVVVGGSCAAINPLPLAAFVDVFALGAAENLLDELLSALEEETDRGCVVERLANRPGFYVPSRHDPEQDRLPAKLRKLELTAEQMRRPGYLPTSSILTPNTEFRDKFLVEMSRGCPEKCRYCWATFGMGTFRWHPTEAILAALEEVRPFTDQLGFLATAVGDHPEIERILEHATASGFRTAVSSIRIPAVTEGVLDALHRSGDRSITLAPETGNDEMRAKMGKPITNDFLLEKVRLIFRHGFTQLKLYFIIGLPEENESDVTSILDLAREIRAIMEAETAPRGVMGHLHLGVNVLVPKPFTPWQRLPLLDQRALKARVRLLRRGVAAMPNVSMGPISPRQAVWQSYISRAGSDAADAIERAAAGEPIATLLRELQPSVEAVVYSHLEGSLRWHFMRTG